MDIQICRRSKSHHASFLHFVADLNRMLFTLVLIGSHLSCGSCLRVYRAVRGAVWTAGSWIFILRPVCPVLLLTGMRCPACSEQNTWSTWSFLLSPFKLSPLQLVLQLAGTCRLLQFLMSFSCFSICYFESTLRDVTGPDHAWGNPPSPSPCTFLLSRLWKEAAHRSSSWCLLLLRDVSSFFLLQFPCGMGKKPLSFGGKKWGDISSQWQGTLLLLCRTTFSREPYSHWHTPLLLLVAESKARKCRWRGELGRKVPSPSWCPISLILCSPNYPYNTDQYKLHGKRCSYFGSYINITNFFDLIDLL